MSHNREKVLFVVAGESYRLVSQLLERFGCRTEEVPNFMPLRHEDASHDLKLDHPRIRALSALQFAQKFHAGSSDIRNTVFVGVSVDICVEEGDLVGDLDGSAEAASALVSGLSEKTCYVEICLMILRLGDERPNAECLTFQTTIKKIEPSDLSEVRNRRAHLSPLELILSVSLDAGSDGAMRLANELTPQLQEIFKKFRLMKYVEEQMNESAVSV